MAVLVGINFIMGENAGMLIFDLDGTLIDSNGVWVEVDKTFLARRGAPYTKEYYKGVAHTILQNCAIFTKEYLGLSESCEEIIDEWMELAAGQYHHVPLKPGVREYLDRCKNAGHRMAVFTACVPEHCQAAMESHSLQPYFEQVIYAQELGVDKRSPAIFRRVAEMLGVEPRVILDFFPYSGEEVMRQSLAVSMGYIAELPFNFSILDVHMWYIYLLIGLYLYLPIFSAWVEKASEKAKLWFLAVWGVTLLIPYYNEFVAQYLWGTCSWNSFGMLYYFAGFNGYLLLGHYLRNHDWTGRQAALIGVPMFVVGYAVTFFGFRHMTALPDFTDEMLELFFTYCSLNVVMMTIPVFMWAKRVNIRSERMIKALSNLTLCGFGVYMIHYFFTGPSVVLMRAAGVPLCLQIPVAAVVAFGVSWFLVAMAYRCFGKKTKWVMG